MKFIQIKNIVNIKLTLKNFYDDLLEKKEEIKFSDLELIFKDLKNFLKKRVL